MGARRGAEVVQGLKGRDAEIWHMGGRVRDVTTEKGFAGCVRSLAGLYDLQWQNPNVSLEEDKATGELVGRSFAIPASPEELVGVGRALKLSADYSMGMLGREPAYLNRAISAYAGAADFFGQREPAFGANIRRYHAHARRGDLALTHTLLNPRPNRLLGPARQEKPDVALHVARERDGGIVLRGARLLATLPMADEIVVVPAKLMDSSQDSLRYAFGAVLPTEAPGLKFICRDSYDYGFEPADHPLGSRFEEMDAVVVFDDVFVPWERVFCYRDLDICGRTNAETGAFTQMAYQVICKNIAKTEFVLGLISLMVDGAGLENFQHIHEKVAEVWVNLEVLKALRRTSELDAAPNQFGVVTPAWDPLDAARNLYPKMYPRMVEIIQQIGASGLVAMPSAADLNGPLAEDIRLYYESARMTAAERIPLYRLAWDVSVSAFATRQVLYERFFFGDPVQLAGVVFQTKNRTAQMEKVRSFLQKACEVSP